MKLKVERSQLLLFLLWWTIITLALYVWCEQVNSQTTEQWKVYKEHVASIPTAERNLYQHISYSSDLELSVLRFVVATHSRTIAIEPILPAIIGGEIGVLDLRGLGWNALHDHTRIGYPYFLHRGTHRPAIIRADWLITYLLDQTRSKQLPFLLTFGVEVKTEEQYRKLFSARGKPTTWIEDNSGVAIQKTRTLNFLDAASHPLWYTRDYEVIDQRTDPLERLLQGDDKHDASEYIGGLPKLSTTTGETSLAQTYALFDGQGKVQFAAPIGIVHDSKGPRGPELRSSLSCIACHTDGLNVPNVNALRRYLSAGALVDVDDPSVQVEIMARYLTKLDKTIGRWNADYEAFTTATAGLSPADVSKAVASIFVSYDAPITLEQAARELNALPEELGRKLRNVQVAKNLPARVTALARGLAIPRTTFEQHWPKLYRLVHEK